MLKFVVVLYRRPDLSLEAFFANLREEHGPLAERIPGLRRYVQNHVLPDPKRKHLGWDAVIELYWDDWESMEAGWASPEGRYGTSPDARGSLSYDLVRRAGARPPMMRRPSYRGRRDDSPCYHDR